MSSRRIEDLNEDVQKAAREHMLRCADAGIELLIYCTLRDVREQSQLYRRGRTTAQINNKIDLLKKQGYEELAKILRSVGPQFGPKVTFAGPGDSYHQYRLAYDCVPLVNGRAVWSTAGEGGEMWQKVGDLGKKAGMEWAGDWKRFREFPHFQMTGGKTVKELKKETFGAAPAPAPAPSFTRRRGFAAAAAAAPAAAVETESSRLRDALDHKHENPEVTATVFLVFASVPGVSKTKVGNTYDTAKLVEASFPETWRTFWVQEPGDLDQDLQDLLWNGGDPSPAVLLSLGKGFDRDARAFDLSDLTDAVDIFGVFSQG